MGGRRRQTRVFLGALLVASGLYLALATAVLARPGGGHTYSGGHDGRGGGRGGNDGSGEIVWLLLQLALRYPGVGIPVVIVVLIGAVWIRRNRPEAWESAPSPSRARTGGAVNLAALRARDPEFSAIVFEDFVYRLFATAHRARHAPAELEALAPYLSVSVRARLVELPPPGAPFTHVVLGALRISRLELPSSLSSSVVGQVQIVLSLDANLTARAPSGPVSVYCQQVWTLSRAAGQLSKPMQRDESFGCPNCGAPFRSGDASRCDHCGEVVSAGRFDWQVVEARVLEYAPRPPLLTSSVDEQGGDRPTIIDPGSREQWATLTADDPALNEELLQARLRVIFDRLNESWTSLDLRPARPLVSDGMFDYLDYWIRAYREQGKRNVLEDMRLLRSVQVKVVRDRHFDAVTLRVWATGRDYTIDTKTSVIEAGSPNQERAYSEYWTLMRGTRARGAPTVAATCPNCAAPLQVSMAGVCEYCSQHITSGEFDFVLSKIEQDEAYAG